MPVQSPKDNYTLQTGTNLRVAFDQIGLEAHDEIFDQIEWIECDLIGVYTSHRSGQSVRALSADFMYRVGAGWGNSIGAASYSDSDGMHTYSVLEDLSGMKKIFARWHADLFICLFRYKRLHTCTVVMGIV